MAKDIWVVSDTHFGHSNIIKYCDRPFQSAEHMDEVLLYNWNQTVKPQDKVYHLGDVYFKNPEILKHLNGHLRLILGNHDDGLDQVLRKRFEKIMVWRHFKEFGLLLTHVPVHSGTLNEKIPKNIHGHIHQNLINDTRYRNVCVEKTDYRPINIEELRIR